MVSKTHKVTGKDGKVIHQHQDHVSTQKKPKKENIIQGSFLINGLIP